MTNNSQGLSIINIFYYNIFLVSTKGRDSALHPAEGSHCVWDKWCRKSEQLASSHNLPQLPGHSSHSEHFPGTGKQQIQPQQNNLFRKLSVFIMMNLREQKTYFWVKLSISHLWRKTKLEVMSFLLFIDILSRVVQIF